jgi:hypothetical protein
LRLLTHRALRQATSFRTLELELLLGARHEHSTDQAPGERQAVERAPPVSGIMRTQHYHRLNL